MGVSSRELDAVTEDDLDAYVAGLIECAKGWKSGIGPQAVQRSRASGRVVGSLDVPNRHAAALQGRFKKNAEASATGLLANFDLRDAAWIQSAFTGPSYPSRCRLRPYQ